MTDRELAHLAADFYERRRGCVLPGRSSPEEEERLRPAVELLL